MMWRWFRRWPGDKRCGCSSILVNGQWWPVVVCTRHLMTLEYPIAAERDGRHGG